MVLALLPLAVLLRATVARTSSVYRRRGTRSGTDDATRRHAILSVSLSVSLSLSLSSVRDTQGE
jgi:hypothetical protein